MSKSGGQTYGQILKSSAVIGSSSLVTIGFGMVRAKAMALLLGPAGVGFLGDYFSISELTRTAAGMGVNTSGVRQIAEAVGRGDREHIARTITTLRRVALYTGALGALLLVAFCKPVSRFTFGDDSHAGSVALLALAVFFADVSAGQAALVQGMRRLGDLARMSVLGAAFGTVLSIPIIYWWREAGLVPALVCVSGMGIVTSWWYARKIKVERVSMPLPLIVKEAGALLKLGIVFMSSGIMTMGAGYLVRIIVTRKLSIVDAGLYHSAWSLGGIYIGFILQAMGADFYPRLTAVAHDHDECNRLVNEQAEVGLLLGGPAVLATLTFAPVVIQIFYSAKFGPAVETFRWICLGMMLRVVSWPMGFILLARGERSLFFWTELFSNLVYICLVWVGVQAFGLRGTGMAFFGLYVLYWIAIYLIVRRLSGFRWSATNRRLTLLLVPLVGGVFTCWYFSRTTAIVAGALLTLLAGIHSLRTLCTLVPLHRLPRAAQGLLTLFRLTPSGNNV